MRVKIGDIFTRTRGGCCCRINKHWFSVLHLCCCADTTMNLLSARDPFINPAKVVKWVSWEILGRCTTFTLNHQPCPCPVILHVGSYLLRLKSFLKSLNCEKDTSGRWPWRRKMLTNSDLVSDQSEREPERQTQTHFGSQQQSEAVSRWIMCIQCRRGSVLDHPRRGSFHPRMSPVSLLTSHSGDTIKY